MRKSKSKSVAVSSALELAHNGQAIPQAVMRSAMANTNSRMPGIAKEKIKLYREANQYRRKLQKPIDSRDSEVARVIGGLRGISDGMAKRKVIAPAATKLTPGILAGSYSLRLTPGYDFGNVNSFPHNSRNSAFVHRSTGELGFNTYAERKGDDAFAFVSIGAFFIPMFGPARMRASINPTLSFAWWTISTGTVAVTLALMDFHIQSFKRDGTDVLNVNETGSGWKALWFNQNGLGLEFNFGSLSDNPMTAGVDVDTNHFYLITLECLGQACSSGSDKPGFTSVAGGILDAMLPYIDIDLRLIPVASQAVI